MQFTKSSTHLNTRLFPEKVDVKVPITLDNSLIVKQYFLKKQE